MDWNGILQDIISGSALLLLGGIGGWISGRFNGKKESVRAIERKDNIYQPLITELEKRTGFNWSIREKLQFPLLRDIVNNPYKYGFNEELQDKCNYLYSIIDKYNDIDPINIAHSIIVDIFEKGYTQIYGSIIDGNVSNCDRDGNEWDEDIIAESVITIRQTNYTKEINSLLLNEGIYLDEVCIDEEQELYIPIHLELKRIYQHALNTNVNGKKHKRPNPILDLNMLPEEYIALNFDFFNVYNNNTDIKKKYELREEIIYTCQSVAQTLKETIEQIIKKYEVEKL